MSLAVDEPSLVARRGRSSTVEPLVVGQLMSVQLRPVTPFAHHRALRALIGAPGMWCNGEHDWLQPSSSRFESWRPCHADEAHMDERLVANEKVAGSMPVIRSRLAAQRL